MSESLRLQKRKRTLRAVGILICGIYLLFSDAAVGQETSIVSAEGILGQLDEDTELLHFAPQDINERSRQALNKIISIDLTDVPKEVALRKIAGAAGLKVALSKDVAQSDWEKPVSVQYARTTVLGGLYKALGDSDLRLTLSSDSGNSQIVVMRGKIVNETVTEEQLSVAEALQETVTGRITDAETGEPLPGVTIVVQGTTIGTTTDGDGIFELNVEDLQQTLAISYVGYDRQAVSLDGRSQLDVELVPDVVGLEDVVVTAIGRERDRDALGHSIAHIDSEDLVRGTEGNLANMLQGQAAGVDIKTVGGGPGSATRVTIRGASSLADDNQPLYVVDGIPIDNRNIGQAGAWGGRDGGDGIQDINPNDIESMSVLKGAAASALYGERARDGVIIIETKRGRDGVLNVNFSSNTTIAQPRFSQDDIQTEYGQGQQGERPQNREEAFQTNVTHWGEPFDGVTTIQWDGVERPYEDLGSQRDALYRTPVSTRNDISVSGGAERLTYFFSASHLNDQGLLPGSGLERSSITVRGTSNVGRFNVDAKANYIDSETSRQGWLQEWVANPNYMANVLARNVPMSTLEENFKTEDGREQTPIPSAFTQNPFWVINEMVDRDDRDRLLGHVNLNFELADWAVLIARSGLDWYTDRRQYIEPWGTAYRPDGRFEDDEWRVRESNTDVFLDAGFDLTPTIRLDGVLGGHLRQSSAERVGVVGTNYTVPGVNALFNMEQIGDRYAFSEKEIRSLYGSAELGYSDFLFLTLTGRQDWSSTLPQENNSFFYPSVSTSFHFSRVLDLPEWLSHGQLRVSWAQVGGDTDPYMLDLTYGFHDGTQRGQPLAFIGTSSVPLADLRPEMNDEIELGFDIRFFDDRVGVDFAWYDRETRNQILSTDVSGTTGYNARTINAGRIDNTGFEIQLMTMPVVEADYFWRSTLNFTRNKNRVVELVPDMEVFEIEMSRSLNVWSTAIPGEEFGTLRGFKYERDEDGNIVHDGGLPVQGELGVLGRGTPSFTVGWSNTLNWQNWTFRALIDAEWGGQIFSHTNRTLYGNGLHANTLVGRAQCDETRGEDGRWQPCFVGQGVDINGGENTEAVLPNAYYGRIASQIPEEFIYDKNVIKLRQLQIGYNLPGEWIGAVGLSSARVSLIGRNLFYLYNPIPNVDPETEINRGNATGLEGFGYPQTRTVGFNIDLSF